MRSNNLPKLLIDSNRYLTKSNTVRQIYYKGNFCEEIFDNCLAVVGSRRATSYGSKVCKQLVSDIAYRGITIVSGFMYGIDAYAHEAALDAGGKTIAVLGYGIKREPTDYQRPLYNRILDRGGLFVSEYGDYEPAQKWTFPKRNRIVAGLCKAVLVVEAAEKSGSLITANYAFKMKRKVFAVPGPLNSKNSIGTAQLIKEGAEIVTRSEDILSIFKQTQNLSFRNGKGKLNTISGGNSSDLREKSLKTQIREWLETEQPTIYELIAEFEENNKNLLKEIIFMQLTGEIYEIEGRYYIK